MQRPRNPLLAFLFIVALVLPWLIFLFLPGGTITGHVLFWLAMFFCLLLLWMVSATQRRLVTAAGPDLGPRMLNEAEQPEAVRQVMDVRIAIKENGVQVFRGPLRDSASVSFEQLNRALPKGFVPGRRRAWRKNRSDSEAGGRRRFTETCPTVVVLASFWSHH